MVKNSVDVHVCKTFCSCVTLEIHFLAIILTPCTYFKIHVLLVSTVGFNLRDWFEILNKEILCRRSQYTNFLKWIMVDKMLVVNVCQPNGKSWGWGGGEIALMNMVIRTKRI